MSDLFCYCHRMRHSKEDRDKYIPFKRNFLLILAADRNLLKCNTCFPLRTYEKYDSKSTIIPMMWVLCKSRGTPGFMKLYPKWGDNQIKWKKGKPFKVCLSGAPG